MSESKSMLRFFVIWVGELISTIGSGLTAFVLGVYAFQITGQASSTALIVLLTFLPAFLLRPFGGVLADRWDRSKLMIIGNVGSAFGIGLILLMMTNNSHHLSLLYPGLILSSCFVAIQNPAFKASVTDYLSKDQYAKASGLVQLAGSAQFLIAPLLAGFLMAFVKVKYILMLDLLSFVLSALAVVMVRSTIKQIAVQKTSVEQSHFIKELVEGFKSITENRGVFVLVLLVSLLLFYIGLIQALLAPMVLSFTDAKTLGTLQSVCGFGMLLSSILISMKKRKGNNVKILCVSMALMGLFFAFIGIMPNFWAVLIPGFLFFVALPFSNSSLDVLIRQNISNEKQGRAWSLISVLTYFGSMVAYACAGFLADHICNPLFMPNGVLSHSLGQFFGVGKGRGIAFIFFIAGLLVILLAILIYRSKSIHALETSDQSDRENLNDNLRQLTRHEMEKVKCSGT